MKLATVAVLSFALGVLATLVLMDAWQGSSGSVADTAVHESPTALSSVGSRGQVDLARPPRQTPPINSSDTSASPQSLPAESRQQIALPDGFEILDTVAGLHHQLEVEETDYAWATYLEPQISAYFADERLSEQQFSAPMVECRRTLCEVQLIGYGPQAFTLWANVTADYASQPWMADLLEPIVQVDRTATGAAAFVIILRRRPGTF